MEKIKLLYLASTCLLQEKPDDMGLTTRHEYVLTHYAKDRVQVAIAYGADGEHEDLVMREGVSYYAVHGKMGIGLSEEEWAITRKELLRVIDAYQPDVIHAFGSEWPYARIAEDTNVPVIVHVMGFLNIYYPSIEMAHGQTCIQLPPVGRKKRLILRAFFSSWLRHQQQVEENEQRTKDAVARVSEDERRLMAKNHYFFGRTNWDRNLVRYYAPSGKYYHVEEAVKPSILEQAGTWKYHAGETLRLFTLSSGDDRKGNEIILRTAKILKELLGLSFEWIVAGSKDFFPAFEKRCGIQHEDVNIQLIGMIDTVRIIDEMQKADFFIHPSIMDNSPHSICEAQLIGCPVIASNVGGVPDLVKHDETGLLYPYNEPHTLAFLIGNYYRSEEELTRISSSEVAEAVRRHDPKTLADEMVSAYRCVIEEHAASAKPNDVEPLGDSKGIEE